MKDNIRVNVIITSDLLESFDHAINRLNIAELNNGGKRINTRSSIIRELIYDFDFDVEQRIERIEKETMLKKLERIMELETELEELKSNL